MSDLDDEAYARAGVHYAALDPGKLRAQRAALATAPGLLALGMREVGESRGESAYVVDLGDRYVTTVNEALGSKNLIADSVRSITGRSHYDTIARDCAATILNDLCTLGGYPVCLMAYWAAGSSRWFEDQQRLADLIDGWSAACREVGCSWGGGETQVLTDMIVPDAVVLGGSAVGMIEPKSRLLLGSHVEPGDAILIAPAVGIHTNGLTLARKVAAQLPNGYRTPVPGDADRRALGEVLLDPTPLYGPLVKALQDADVGLHYAAHITGHGWRKLMRSPNALSYIVRELPEVPPVFELLCREAKMKAREAYGTFNMGAGFALFVEEADVARASHVAWSAGWKLLHAGHVEAGGKRVVLQPLGITFEGDSLQIRDAITPKG